MSAVQINEITRYFPGLHLLPKTQTIEVPRYDHRCNYQEGDRVWVDNRYGQSLATIIKIIRQPGTFCDKALLEFEDDDYRAKWERERSTPYFAINSSRTVTTPSVVTVEASPRKVGRWRGPLCGPAAVEPEPQQESLRQGFYRKFVERYLRERTAQTVTAADLHEAILTSGHLTASDLVEHPTKPGKAIWSVQFQSAIKHLKKVGVIECPQRGHYQKAR